MNYFGIINIHILPDEVFQLIQKYIVSTNYDNHNIPQYMFITDGVNWFMNRRTIKIHGQ